jgi:hypothetical protein
VDAGSRPLLARLVQSEIQTLTDLLKHISLTMTAEHVGDEQDWLFALVDNATTTIKATSTIGPSGSGLVDENFWDSPAAVAYLERQRQAIRLHHVTVRRIFIAYQRDLSGDDAFRQTIRSQRNAGIEVRVLPAPPTNHFGTIDFIVFDDEISYEFSSSPVFGSTRTSTVQSTQLVLREELVRRRVAQFEEWWEQAVESPAATADGEHGGGVPTPAPERRDTAPGGPSH